LYLEYEINNNNNNICLIFSVSLQHFAERFVFCMLVWFGRQDSVSTQPASCCIRLRD